ncbi:hypothetical protein [Sorangium sp. So ce1000]|uniref:hypothetical protein n=1 Tax=Sorangium sp. So ce1000 TaxID=3133325 RepID=UPI003F60D27F
MTHGEDDSSEIYEPVPRAAMRLFRLTWQLETWLRLLVYVELRSVRSDWEELIKQHVRGWPPSSFGNDKRLHHMATSHQAALSYLTFGELWTVISEDDNWPLFAPYFPPRLNTQVRVDEIKTIRNRVAHFREPHPQDEARLELFMRDLEPGLRRFCIRYTNGKIPSSPIEDPVTQRLATSWEHVGYGIELECPDRNWLYAPGRHRSNPKLNATLRIMTHEGHKHGSAEGVIYRLTLQSNTGRQLNVVEIIDSTRQHHNHIIHFLISPSVESLSITVPAIHGVDTTANLVAAFLRAGINCTHSVTNQDMRRAHLEWPEYVLRPNHMLSFFFEEMVNPVVDVT